MRQQGWGESSDGKAGRRWSEHRKYPTDREWLKTQDTIKGDRTKGQTLGSKNDTRAKKNQTWPRRLENEPDKTGSGGKDRKQPRKEDPGSGPSITIWLPQPRKKRDSQNKTESEKVTLGNGLRQRKAILPEILLLKDLVLKRYYLVFSPFFLKQKEWNFQSLNQLLFV